MTTETLYALNITRTYRPDEYDIRQNTDTYDTITKGNIIVVASIDEVATLAKRYIADIIRFECTVAQSGTDLVISSYHDYTIDGLTANSVRLFHIGFRYSNETEERVTYNLRAAKVAYQKP